MSHQTKNPGEVHALLGAEQAFTYLDVRAVEEFDAGHVPGAYNIPLLFKTAFGMQPNPAFVSEVERHFVPERKLVLGCRSGVRSERACELLAARGFTTLVNMSGGWHGAMDQGGRVLERGWAACGFEEERVAQPGRSHAELRHETS